MMITFSKSFDGKRRQSRLRFKDDAFPTTRRGFRDAKLLEDGTTHRRRRRERSLDENVVWLWWSSRARVYNLTGGGDRITNSKGKKISTSV